MYRILLVEDHATVREALAFVFDREPELAVVAQAESIAEARRVEVEFDIAVIDLGLPDGEGADLIRELHTAYPQRKLLVLSAYTERIEFARAVEAGASGTLHKATPLGEIVQAIKRVKDGEELLSPTETVEMLRLVNDRRNTDLDEQRAVSQLTRREREVLQVLAEGLSDHEIATRLGISFDTERSHISNVLVKLKANSRLRALVLALRYKVVELR